MSLTPNVGMPTVYRWPFPQDPIPRSWVAASKVTVAAVGIFSKIVAGQWHHAVMSFAFEAVVLLYGNSH